MSPKPTPQNSPAPDSLSESKVYKKRPHRKVKSGCNTCKKRKIKCDEEKPKCANCNRYEAECVYPSPSELARERGPRSTTPDPARGPRSLSDDVLVAFCGTSRGSDELQMGNIALMHQWCTATYCGFGNVYGVDGAPWKLEIPLLAQHYPFLMRGILAISALHLARNVPDLTARQKYLRVAAYHQDLALPEYRSTILDVTEANVAAVMAFSAFATIYAFAAPQDPATLFARGATGWIFMHRGMSDMPAHWQSWLEKTCLADQMHRRRLQPIDPTVHPNDGQLLSLHRLLVNTAPEEAQRAVAYEGALFWLRQAFAHTARPESGLGPKHAALFWIERVPQDYVELLRQQDARAFVLLAHCGVLLKRAAMFWQFAGFAEHVLEEIRVVLDEEYVAWMQWPLVECGLSGDRRQETGDR